MITEEKIQKMFAEGQSPHEIAENLGLSWNHMKVRRVLKRLGIPPRTKSEAQRIGLERGRCKNPKVADQQVYNDKEDTNNEK